MKVNGRSLGEGQARSAPLAIDIRVAAEAWEFEQIHRLNYLTFVEEIPQHQPGPSGVLKDRFHEENTYLIAARGRQIVGMVAVRGARPFSLDEKVPDLARYLPPGQRVCELRLLALDKGARSGTVMGRLLLSLWRYCLAQGYDAAVISGTTRQLALYRHLGFEPFGALVGSAAAAFQPMLITRERAEAAMERAARRRGQAAAC